jgi:hypothetical protein
MQANAEVVVRSWSLQKVGIGANGIEDQLYGSLKADLVQLLKSLYASLNPSLCAPRRSILHHDDGRAGLTC